jgi:hypothetical protein
MGTDIRVMMSMLYKIRNTFTQEGETEYILLAPIQLIFYYGVKYCYREETKLDSSGYSTSRGQGFFSSFLLPHFFLELLE